MKELKNIDKYRVNSDFYEDCQKTFNCPACAENSLRCDKKSLNYWSTTKSKEAFERGYEDWDPEYEEWDFVGKLVCNQCTEEIAISGIVENEWVVPDPWGEEGEEPHYEKLFKIRYYSNPIKPFIPPKNTPAHITALLLESFELSKINHSAAANRLRVLLELVLKPYLGDTKVKTLDAMIQSIGSRMPEIKVVSLAAKHIGNEGSHGNDVTEYDLCAGYYYVDHLLRRLFDDEYALIRLAQEGVSK